MFWNSLYPLENTQGERQHLIQQYSSVAGEVWRRDGDPPPRTRIYPHRKRNLTPFSSVLFLGNPVGALFFMVSTSFFS